MTQGSPQTYADMLLERGPLDTFELVRVATSDRIATVTLNDPEHLNSYPIRRTGELREALRRAEDAADVRVVILTGTGKAFSAGGDLRRMRESSSAPLERYEFIRHEFGGLIKQIVTMDKPVIAAINGYAMGVGLFTALSCDMIIASDQGKFGTAYIHLGLTPLGVSYLLAKILGYCRAYELCALGDVFDAWRAEALGLVNCVVPHEHLLEETHKIACRLADGPAARAWIRQAAAPTCVPSRPRGAPVAWRGRAAAVPCLRRPSRSAGGICGEAQAAVRGALGSEYTLRRVDGSAPIGAVRRQRRCTG